MNPKWKIAMSICLLLAIFSGVATALSSDVIFKNWNTIGKWISQLQITRVQGEYDGYGYQVHPGYEEPGSDFCGEGVDMVVSETGEIVTVPEGKTRGCGGQPSDTAPSPQNKKLFDVFSLNKKYTMYCSSCGTGQRNTLTDSVGLIKIA